MTDSSDTQNQHPVDRLHDHIDEVEGKADDMQERLDDLGEGIASARQQAEADELLPTEDADGPTDSPVDSLEWPEGDPDVETPVTDAEHPPGG